MNKYTYKKTKKNDYDGLTLSKRVFDAKKNYKF